MAILIRFVFMALQLAALTGDIVAVAKCPDPPKYFIGIDTFGGRFKYFTHLTLVRCDHCKTIMIIFCDGFFLVGLQWINTAYFSIAFLIDLFAAKRLRVYADYLFTTVAWMMSFVSIALYVATWINARYTGQLSYLVGLCFVQLIYFWLILHTSIRHIIWIMW